MSWASDHLFRVRTKFILRGWKLSEALRIELTEGIVAESQFSEVSGAPLVVLVHGLSGGMEEHLHLTAEDYFLETGFSVLRWNLYGDSSGTRKLRDCSVAIHAADLDIVVKTMRHRLSVPVSVVGHSLGGLTALMAKEKFDALVLWESTVSQPQLLEDVEWIDALDAFVWRGRVDKVLNKVMVDELRTIDVAGLAATRTESMLVISDDSPGRPERLSELSDAASLLAKFLTVPNSDHNFSRSGNRDFVFRETAEWMRTAIS